MFLLVVSVRHETLKRMSHSFVRKCALVLKKKTLKFALNIWLSVVLFFLSLMLNIFSSLVSGNCLMIKTKTINSTQLLRLLKTRSYQNSNSLNQAHSDSGTTQIQPTVDRITLLLPFWPLSLSQKIKKSIIYFSKEPH